MIPENDYSLATDPKVQEIINRAIKQIKEDGIAVFSSYNSPYSLTQCVYVAKEFIKKGYYAKKNMFPSGKWQCVIISKKPLEEFSSPNLYSVML